MPEIIISQKQSTEIGNWLKAEAEQGRVELLEDVDKRVTIPFIDGNPVILGGLIDREKRVSELVFGSPDVLNRMRQAGLDLTPTAATVEVVHKWIYQVPWVGTS